MLREAPISKINEWVKARKTSNDIILVLIDRIDRLRIAKKFDYHFPELAPSPELAQKYKQMLCKFLRIAQDMRSWGEAGEGRILGARIKAFTEAYGLGAAYYKRSIANNAKAMESISRLASLNTSGKTVVLFSEEEHQVSHRFIIMQKIGPWRNLIAMFSELKYSSEYMRFAKAIDNRRTI